MDTHKTQDLLQIYKCNNDEIIYISHPQSAACYNLPTIKLRILTVIIIVVTNTITCEKLTLQVISSTLLNEINFHFVMQSWKICNNTYLKVLSKLKSF